jgi:chemotaxis family two-component system response regulator Rcp1
VNAPITMTHQVLHRSLGRPVQILLVEDSPSDVAMTVAALREGHIANDMHVAGDGETALDFLYRRGEFTNAPRPDLILLDLNLPRRDGREVLAEVKADDDLKAIPIVVLTTSAAESDVMRIYRLHANSYVAKPVGFEQFLSAVQQIETFWLTLARLSDGVGPSPEPRHPASC